MEQQDCRIDTYSTLEYVDMKIVHVPTGEFVTGRDTWRFRLRKKLMKELEDRVSKYIDMNEQTVIRKFSDGDVWEAIKICKEKGYSKLLKNFLKSTEILKNKNLYKSHYEKNNERIPGAQKIPDERQMYVMYELSQFNPKCMLDIGCADGSFAFFCLKEKIVEKVIGIDPWIEGIEYANNRTDSNSIFIQGIVEDIDIPQDYDIIHLGELIEHVIEPLDILNKVIHKEIKAIVSTVPVVRPELSSKEVEIVTKGSPAEHVRACNEKYLDELFKKV